MDLPKTRAEAIAQGAPHYFTGKPCKRGHVAKRFASGVCFECNRENAANWQEANPEGKREQRRKSRNANLEQERERTRRWYEANRERHRESGRNWRLANIEKVRENDRKYREANKDRLREVSRKYRAANHELLREKKRDYREANRDKIREDNRNWREANPERYREFQCKYFKRNKKKIRAKIRKWFSDNPEKRRAYVAQRHARKLQATPTWLTQEHRDEIVDIYAQAVLVEQLTGVPQHVDHIEPLQGEDRCGLHVPWNLQILTAEENVRKHNRSHDPSPQASI